MKPPVDPGTAAGTAAGTAPRTLGARVPSPASVRREPFGATRDGVPVEAFVLTNAHGVELRFLPLGGTVVSLTVPDREGTFADVTLGLDTVDGYLTDDRYFGAIVGRYANRIARGRFTLDGTEHRLACNDGANHLHGGPGGFHRATWDVEPFARGGEVGAVLRYTSPHGEEGYPGTLTVRATYTLTDANEWIVDFAASTDRATPVSLTQHAYWNLAGHDAGDVLGHELTLCASRFTPVGESLIPTGALQPVYGTPFDFTTPRLIGERIDAGDAQLRHGQGYDHNFALDRSLREVVDGAPTLAARLREPRSGRVLELFTTAPGLQFYSGNVLHGRAAGKGGRVYPRRGGLALEPQHFPDAPNQPAFPTAILRPGDTYAARTVYRFSVETRP